MAFGDALLNLLGQKDPRLALIAGMQGGGVPAGATPQAGAGAPAGAGMGGGTAAPAQPAAYTSPPELAKLYADLMERQNKAEMIDRGIGMIGMSIAQDQNKEAVARLAGGGGNRGDSSANNPAALVNQIMQFQTEQAALRQKAAMRAALPSLAKQYGISLEAAQYLFDSGKLDSVIAEAEKPNKQIIQNADDTHSIIDLNSGTIGTTFGVPKKREIEIISDDNGNKFAVYKDTGERVGTNNIVEGQGATNDEKLWRADEKDRATRGLPSRSLSQFIQDTNRSRAGASNLGASGIDYGNPPPDMAWKRDEKGNVSIDANGAPIPVPLPNTKLALEAEKNSKASETKDQKKVLKNTIVSANIDEAIDAITSDMDSWLPWGNTGLSGTAMASIPGTDAYDLAGKLGTIKTNIGLGELQSMRESSPTGASLGAISDFENKMLQGAQGSLDQGNKDETLIKNLVRVKYISDAIINEGIKDEKAAAQLIAKADAEAKQIIKAARGEGRSDQQIETPADMDINALIDKHRTK